MFEKYQLMSHANILWIRRCILRRGRSVAKATALSAPISLLIDRNYTITVCFFYLDQLIITSGVYGG